MSSSNKYHFRFYDWEEKLRDKPFLRQPFGDNWEVCTWGEAGQIARKLATGLKSLGLEKGSHIGLMSKNCREWIIADLAIIMAGYVSVPFFPNLKSHELKIFLNLEMLRHYSWVKLRTGMKLKMVLTMKCLLLHFHIMRVILK